MLIRARSDQGARLLKVQLKQFTSLRERPVNVILCSLKRNYVIKFMCVRCSHVNVLEKLSKLCNAHIDANTIPLCNFAKTLLRLIMSIRYVNYVY